MKDCEHHSDQVVGGICRVLSVTLMRYCDSESRRLVLDFIRFATKPITQIISTFSRLARGKQPQAVAKAVHGALLEGGAGGWRKARPTLALAKHCVAGLAWSCAVLDDEAAWTDDGTKFVEVHSILLPVIMGASAPKQEARALKLLEQLLSKKGVQQKYISALLASEATLNLLELGEKVLSHWE